MTKMGLLREEAHWSLVVPRRFSYGGLEGSYVQSSAGAQSKFVGPLFRPNFGPGPKNDFLGPKIDEAQGALRLGRLGGGESRGARSLVGGRRLQWGTSTTKSFLACSSLLVPRFGRWEAYLALFFDTEADGGGCVAWGRRKSAACRAAGWAIGVVEVDSRVGAGDVRCGGREVEFAASGGSFGALTGVFCVEFDADDDGELCLGSGRPEMGANGASGAKIGVAGRGAVLSGRVADSDRFPLEPGSFSGFRACFEA